jgi:four helix bundle protein
MASPEERREIRDYKDLIAWQKSRAFCKVVYDATRSFPKDELYGLTQQIRRCSVSVPSNIAEGYGRGSQGDYIRFLLMARGSQYELETQILIAQDLGYLPGEVDVRLLADLKECMRILQGLINSLGGSCHR